jgi:hypothetical protein
VVAPFVPNPNNVRSRGIAPLFVPFRVRRRLLPFVVLLAASGFWWGGPRHDAHAACMAPALRVVPREGPPGGTVIVEGYGWSTGCADTVGCTDGGPCARDSKAPPRGEISLRFSQGGQSDWLATANADSNNRFVQEVVIPDWAKLGAASIHADGVLTGFKVAPAGSGGLVDTKLERQGRSGAVAGAGAGAEADLAKTGAAMDALLLGGALLLALGLAARRTAAPR